MMAIISLTSIPSRFAGLGAVLEALLAQDRPVEEIRLYLPRRYRRFPDYRGERPAVPTGVRLIEVEEDFGPATKVLHAARALSGEDMQILFLDDDRLYPRNWARRLLTEQDRRPDMAVTGIGSRLDKIQPERCNPPLERAARFYHGQFDPRHKARRLVQLLHRPAGPKPARRKVLRAGHVEILHGYAGAVIRPDFIDDAFFDIPDSLWMVDDIWLSGHLARRGIPIWAPAQMEYPPKSPLDSVDPLYDFEYDGAERVDSNRRALNWFQRTHGLWQPPIVEAGP